MSRRLLLLSASALAVATTPAVAQDEPQNGAAVAIDDIIVTALRREGTVQGTPVSVTALTGEALERTGRDGLGALRAVPGVVAVESGPGNTRMVMRGLQSVGEATVGVYYDDAPVTGVVGTQNDAGGTTPGLRLFDVDRVEVLRGPQGTLYGSGSTGGAVKVVFNKPTLEHEAVLAAEVGFGEGGPDSLVQGMINLPLGDRASLRAVGFSQQIGGWIENVSLGDSDVNDTQAYGGRVLLRFDPIDRLRLLGEAHYQAIEGDRTFWNLELGAYRSNSRVRQPSSDRLALFSLSAEYDFSGMTANAIVSHQNRAIDQASGDPSFYFQALTNNPAACARLRGGGAPCAPAVQADFNTYVSGFVYGQLISFSDVEATSGEVRLASKGDRLVDWTVGLFASARGSDIDNNQLRADPLTGGAITPFDRQTRRLVRDELDQTAVFGEASIDLGRQFNLTVGGRYFDYRRRVGGATVVPLDLINARLSTWSEVRSAEDGWVGRLNLSWAPDRDTLVYAQAAQGFRPGGVNQVLGLPAELGPYTSDKVLSYEIGFKREWFENRLVTNLSAYRTDWENMQVSGMTPSGPFSFISNAGAARINGAELEVVARPIENLEIRAGGSYVDATLSEDQLNTNITANGRAGDRIPFVPRVTWNADLNYTRPLQDGWLAAADLSVTHIGESFSEFRPVSPFYRRLPDYTLVRLQVSAASPDAVWEAAVFVDNATDEVAVTALFSSGFSTGQSITTSQAPRRIGFRLQHAF